MNLLDGVFADIERSKDISGLRVVDFYVNSPFTVVRLSDGATGSAGNYAVQNHATGYEPELAKEMYRGHIKNDPLLMETLRHDRSLVGLSLRTAILSALSQDLLNSSTLRSFGLAFRHTSNQHNVLQHYMRAGDIVAMIGFGGALDDFCRSNQVNQLYVCDFMFKDQEVRDVAWRHVKAICRDPRQVTLVDEKATENAISLADICFVTGSAVCNGTMEGLLALAGTCREIIVQGPSCSLLPMEFFRRSVSMVLTTIKSAAEFEAGRHPDDRIYDWVDENYIAITCLARMTDKER